MRAKSQATQSQQPMQKLLIDRKSAAWGISVSTRSVDYLIASGALETRRIGRKVLIVAASLKKFAAANHYGPVNGSDKEAA
jgi:hypothetical protein